MKDEQIILSMTTWPPRYETTGKVMAGLVNQIQEDNLQERVHALLVLSEEEVCSTYARKAACDLMSDMEKMGVEVIIDRGNIRSHKKLMPTLEKYPGHAVLVVDDDQRQQQGWLKTFIMDQEAHPDDIIYGMSTSRVFVLDRTIIEKRPHGKLWLSTPGMTSRDLKPANGSSGTLYPANTFKDERFFDRELYMSLSPSSDETWQWAFGKMAGKTYRCLSAHNLPYPTDARTDCALWNENKCKYDVIHNAIAKAIPDYLEALLNDAK